LVAPKSNHHRQPKGRREPTTNKYKTGAKMEIKIWQFEDSPEEYRFMYDDVDFIAFVPDAMIDMWNMFFFKNIIWEVNCFPVDGGTVYIQVH
jgi:hypothetical protein